MKEKNILEKLAKLIRQDTITEKTKIYYTDDRHFQLKRDYIIEIDFKPKYFVRHNFITLDTNGKLTLEKGHAWRQNPIGTAEAFVAVLRPHSEYLRASLIRDALYQLKLNHKLKTYSTDKIENFALDILLQDQPYTAKFNLRSIQDNEKFYKIKTGQYLERDNTMNYKFVDNGISTVKDKKAPGLPIIANELNNKVVANISIVDGKAILIPNPIMFNVPINADETFNTGKFRKDDFKVWIKHDIEQLKIIRPLKKYKYNESKDILGKIGNHPEITGKLIRFKCTFDKIPLHGGTIHFDCKIPLLSLPLNDETQRKFFSMGIITSDKSIYFKDNYKYQLNRRYSVQTHLLDTPSSEQFMRLDRDGLLTIENGFCWDGPSGPMPDRGSICEQVWCMMHSTVYLRHRHLQWNARATSLNGITQSNEDLTNLNYKEYADFLFAEHLKEDGTSESDADDIRQDLGKTVEGKTFNKYPWVSFADNSADPKNENPITIVPSPARDKPIRTRPSNY